jgi:Leucine Rich repeat
MTGTAPTSSETAKPPHQKRWIPLSLKIFVALLAILTVVAGWEGGRSYRQHVAIRQIKRLGAYVTTAPGGPDWLRHLVGNERMEMFDLVESVDLEGTGWTDADLVHVSSLREPKRLGLGRALYGSFSRGWEHHKSFMGLNAVYAKHCSPITDSGLANISRMAGLQGLDLYGSQISDAGLEHVGKLVGLQDLDLSYTQVTDAGLAALRNLKSLRQLSLQGTQISGAGLVHLRALPALERLDLRLTKVSDAELSHLAGMTRLEALGLDGTLVTDASLPHLKTLVNLEFMDATHITKAGWVELRQALPKLLRFPKGKRAVENTTGLVPQQSDRPTSG